MSDLSVWAAPIPGTQASDAEVAAAVAAALPWSIDVPLFVPPITHTNFATLALSVSNTMYAELQNNGSQNSTVTPLDVVLGAGTWVVGALQNVNTDRGIMSFQLDGVEVTTIDGYNGSLVRNTRSTSGSFVVATTGVKRLSIVMAAKHASSTNYYASIQQLRLRRTA